MSDCFKRSDALPIIVQHAETDSESVQEMKELLLHMTAFHDNERVHIEAVTETLGRMYVIYFTKVLDIYLTVYFI